MLLLDTNVVSAVMHRVPGALLRLSKEEPGKIILCSPVAAEIHYGLSRLAEGSRRHRLLTAEYQRLRDAVQWADWSEPAAIEFGRIKASLQQQGIPVDDMDMDIAIGSVALTIDARVATRNIRHLARISGLVVEDWTDELAL
jgi:tRNA(fMet)-specific endonuclease VapC